MKKKVIRPKYVPKYGSKSIRWYMDGNDLVGSYEKIEGLKEISTDDMADLCYSQQKRPKGLDGLPKYGVNSIIVKLAEFDDQAFIGYENKEDEWYHSQIIEMVSNQARMLCGSRDWQEI